MAAETLDFFTAIFGAETSSRMFKTYTVGPKEYKLWSVYALKPDNAAQVRSDLDAMAAVYDQDFKLVGFWRFDDGVPLGMDWDESDPPELVGTVAYPTPAWAVNFMPDVYDNSEPPVASPPTELTDVISLSRQAKRIFM